jgi:hypothetical protein
MERLSLQLCLSNMIPVRPIDNINLLLIPAGLSHVLFLYDHG